MIYLTLNTIDFISNTHDEKVLLSKNSETRKIYRVYIENLGNNHLTKFVEMKH
jgi:hypothetical protein